MVRAPWISMDEIAFRVRRIIGMLFPGIGSDSYVRSVSLACGDYIVRAEDIFDRKSALEGDDGPGEPPFRLEALEVYGSGGEVLLQVGFNRGRLKLYNARGEVEKVLDIIEACVSAE